MTSPEKWICDGISKNKKLAAGAEEAHPPHENYSPDCATCGLPKEALIEPPKALPVKAILIAIAGILILGGSGTAYTLIAKECESGLEKVEGECIDPFLQPYQKAAQQGDEAILLAKDYQSIQDLAKAQLSLGDAIKQLDLIPTEALIYSEVGMKITKYKTSKADIISSLNLEKMALTNLQASEKTAQEAKAKMTGNRTINELKSAKKKWLKAKAILQEIDSSSLVFSQVEQHVIDYNLEIKGIDSRIAAMAKSIRLVPVRNTYQAPKKRYTPTRKKKYSAPRRKTVNSDDCAVNKSPNCLF